MTIHDALQQSDIILIEGSKKVGKLTFSLFEISRQKAKVLILSTYPKQIFEKRLKAISFIKDEKLQQTIKKLEYLNLKENWEDFKIQFGYKFLLEDLKRIIKTFNPDILIFQRIDLLFSISDIEEVKPFMEELIEIKGKIKLWITAVPNQDNTSCIEIIENFSDLNLIIKRTSQRILSIKHSIFPIRYEECQFLYNGERLNLSDSKEKKVSINKKKILIVSQDKNLLNLNRYIFDKPMFELKIATNTSDVISKILENPHIVIYNSDRLDISICKMKEKIDSKILYIVNKEYVRVEDKMLAIKEGCEDILPNRFLVGEYILEVEKLINFHFYTSLLNKFPKNKIANSLENFCKIINSLYLERIVFTLIKFTSELNLEKIADKLRNKDIIYFDGKFYYVVLINVRKGNLKPIFEKLYISKADIIEAFEWEETKICK